ncbi:M56 family metallopeptidase [Nonlabens xiamenensis]|uniref:M56 family metallopeptidase n=1 Tax=Nonlabens xiamenensis TaxID=2341043 RepID=UPI000F60FA68|nr:M56 family metallopeptidase [Nonlabens xiamenensis]
MMEYVINSSICLFVFWLTYRLLLEDSSWHSMKRWYLLGSLMLSFLIPTIVVSTQTIPIVEVVMSDYVATPVEDSSVQQLSAFNWWYLALGVYILGWILMAWRFVRNVRSFRIEEEDLVTYFAQYRLVLKARFTVPHSFINRIFVAKKDYEDPGYPSIILEHEKAHLDQKHSLDILLIELITVFLWFNPLMYLIKYSIKLNHEFLADRAVLQQGMPTHEYQELILRHATCNYEKNLSNTFHFPIIKKRFNIMKTKTSYPNGLLRGFILLPITALLIYSCGKEEVQFEEIQEIVEEPMPAPLSVEEKETIEVIEIIPDLNASHIADYNRLAIKHKEYMDENDMLIVFKDDTSYMQTIFYSMTEQQRADAEPWPYLGRLDAGELKPGEIPPPPPPAPAMEDLPPPPPPAKSKEDLPPPPPPMSAIDYINAHREELNYYINGKKVQATEAIKIIEDKGQNGVEISRDATGKNAIKINFSSNDLNAEPDQMAQYPSSSDSHINIDDPARLIKLHQDNYEYLLDGKSVSHKTLLQLLSHQPVYNSHFRYVNRVGTLSVNTKNIQAGPTGLPRRC